MRRYVWERSDMIMSTVSQSIYRLFTKYVVRPQIKNLTRQPQPPILDAMGLMTLESTLSTAKYIYEKMQNAKLFDNKLDLLNYALSQVNVGEMFFEFGVYKGVTVNHIAKRINGKVIYGFDSFEGLPDHWRVGMERGHFKLDKLPEVDNNVKLVAGYFDASIPNFLQGNQISSIAFMHIDCDLYTSTKTIFNNLHPYLANGTIIVFDEYFNYPGWQLGEFKAFQELILENGWDYEYIGAAEEQVAVRIIIPHNVKKIVSGE